jgi:hypothetical protein
VLLMVALGGCARAQAASTASTPLLGTWFDNESGGEYQFISDTLLVVPHTQSGGGNAVTYQILDGNKLDILTGTSHRVSIIESMSADAMVLREPVSGVRQRLFRDITRTRHIKTIEKKALAAASDFATVTADATIVWAAPKPTGKGTEWTDWAPTTITTYGTSWDWSHLQRDKTPARTSGGGDAMGYSFGFTRIVPTAAQLDAIYADTSIEATGGQRHIDVGYSAGKAKYAAGTMVYLPGGLIYSLGDGYAIRVGLDRKNESFVPITRN